MASHGLTIGFIWLIVTGFTGPATAQHTIPAQPSELVLRGGTREVLLDFVVRDKHQREVKDIRPEEVEIYEDSARQTLKSFQYRSGKEAQPVTTGVRKDTAQAVKLDPLREIN